MSVCDIEQAVRKALERATKTTLLFAPGDELALLGNQHLWQSESLLRLAKKYGPVTPEVLFLVQQFMARDPKMHFSLHISALEWQPDIVVALAEAAIKEHYPLVGPAGSPLDLLLE